MRRENFKLRRSVWLWRHALSLSFVLTLVPVGLRHDIQAASGALDPTFGNGGKVTTDFGSNSDNALAIARQSDGKLVVAGVAGGDEVSQGDFALARYNDDGSLDSTFGIGGRVKTDFSNTPNQDRFDLVYAIAIQPDGKIVAAGSTCPGDGGNLHLFCSFALARYDANGSLDVSFGTGGKVTTTLNLFTFDGSFAKAIAIQPDGKIIAAGGALDPAGDDAEVFALVRYETDGNLDMTFGRHGQSVTLLNNCECGAVNAIALQSDGKILAAGGYYFGLARYNSNGNLDATFGNAGVVTSNDENAYATAAVLQPDGKIVAAGFIGNYLTADFALGRFNSNGSLDSSFGIGGKVTTDFSGADSAFAIALQPDGKLVVTGVFSTNQGYDQDFALARYNSDGGLDTSFGSGGKLTTDFGANSDNARTAVVQPDGKIVAVGSSCTPQSCDFALVRYLSDALPPPANPIDDSQFFVRQQYLDFLNREPDAGGLAYWTDRITQCGLDERCIHERRIGVSAAFFIEQEFQDTGYYVYRFYKASFGRQPNYTEFTSDRGKVIVGSSLEVNRQAFADEWVQRAAFTQAYPNTLSNAEVVNKLFDSAGLTASIYDSQRQQELQTMSAGRSRALVLRDVIEIPDFKNIPDPSGLRYNELKQTSQYNPAFLLMQYYGYLRRDIDQGGYGFWLEVVNNREPNNYRAMVCAFITSAEYQLRFGAAVTSSNADCGQ